RGCLVRQRRLTAGLPAACPLRLWLWLRFRRRRGFVDRGRIGHVDGDAARVLLPRADVHADPAAAEAAAADAATAGAYAHATAAVAVRGTAEQHAVGAELRGFLAQLGDHRVHLVLLAVGERAAAALQQRDFLVAARRRGEVDAHLRRVDRRTRGAGDQGGTGTGRQQQAEQGDQQNTHG